MPLISTPPFVAGQSAAYVYRSILPYVYDRMRSKPQFSTTTPCPTLMKSRIKPLTNVFTHTASDQEINPSFNLAVGQNNFTLTGYRDPATIASCAPADQTDEVTRWEINRLPADISNMKIYGRDGAGQLMAMELPFTPPFSQGTIAYSLYIPYSVFEISMQSTFSFIGSVRAIMDWTDEWTIPDWTELLTTDVISKGFPVQAASSANKFMMDSQRDGEKNTRACRHDSTSIEQHPSTLMHTTEMSLTFVFHLFPLLSFFSSFFFRTL